MFGIGWKAYKLRSEIKELNVVNLDCWIRMNTNYKITYFDENSVLPIDIKPGEKGFVYTTDVAKCMYIRHKMNSDVKLKTMLHELGHILFDGKKTVTSREEKEENAWKFCNVALNPNKFLQMLYFAFTKNVIFCIILALMFCHASYSYVESKNTEDNMVYITKSGNAYHVEDCSSIKNSDKMKINIKEAQKAYDKCFYCKPN